MNVCYEANLYCERKKRTSFAVSVYHRPKGNLIQGNINCCSSNIHSPTHKHTKYVTGKVRIIYMLTERRASYSDPGGV